MRARDFIFEAVSRRGFLKGLGAAAAAQAAGVKIPTSAPTPTPTPTTSAISATDIDSLFYKARDNILDYDRSLEDLYPDGVPDQDLMEPQGLTGSMPNEEYYEILQTPKGRPYLLTFIEYGDLIITFKKDNSIHYIKVEWDQGPGELIDSETDEDEELYYKIMNNIFVNSEFEPNENIGKLVDLLIDSKADSFDDSKKQTTQFLNQTSTLLQKTITKYLGNKFQDKILSNDIVKQILNQLISTSPSTFPTSDNVIDVEPTDVTVHEPMQALPAPQQALPPPTLSDIEANFVQALGRDLTDQEQAMIKQEYDKKLT